MTQTLLLLITEALQIQGLLQRIWDLFLRPSCFFIWHLASRITASGPIFSASFAPPSAWAVEEEEISLQGIILLRKAANGKRERRRKGPPIGKIIQRKRKSREQTGGGGGPSSQHSDIRRNVVLQAVRL